MTKNIDPTDMVDRVGENVILTATQRTVADPDGCYEDQKKDFFLDKDFLIVYWKDFWFGLMVVEARCRIDGEGPGVVTDVFILEA